MNLSFLHSDVVVFISFTFPLNNNYFSSQSTNFMSRFLSDEEAEVWHCLIYIYINILYYIRYIKGYYENPQLGVAAEFN